MSTSYSHLAVCVSDLARARLFYTEVFGCEVGAEYQGTGPVVSQLMGVADADFAGVFLSHGAVLIELLSYATTLPAAGPRRADSPGFAHISFTVDDIDGILAKVTQRGGLVLGRVGIPFGRQPETQILFVTDPDHNRIELVWHPNAAAASAHSRFLGLTDIGWPERRA